MNEALLQYIKKNVDLGHDIGKIKQALVGAGHDVHIVEEHASHVLGLRKKKNIKPIFFAILILIMVAAASYFSFIYFKKENADLKNLNEDIIIQTQQEISSFFNDAILKNDSSSCSKIVSYELKRQCMNRFSINSENTTCDSSCMDKKTLNDALISNNVTLCLSIKEKLLKAQCEGILKV